MVFRIDEKEKRNPKTDIVIHSWPWSGQQKPLVKILSAQVVNIRSAATTLGYRVLNPDGSLHSGAAEIYFETTGGYLPLSRIVTNGQGTLSIKAQNMTLGQSLKVKAGFKYYPGKAECLITVA